MFDPADAPDPDLVYRNYLPTCEMLGIDPVPRERALGLVQEWTECYRGARNRRRTSKLDTDMPMSLSFTRRRRLNDHQFDMH